MKFGINQETRGTSILPIDAPVKLPAVTAQWKKGYEFPIVKLLNVKFVKEKEVTRSGVTQVISTLEFFFQDAKKKQFTHVEFPIDTATDNKAEQKIEWLNQRIKHIWDETIGAERMPTEGIGTTAKTIEEYFEATAKAFNGVTYTVGEGESAKTYALYSVGQLYLKLTYNDDRVQIPMFPNFVQRALGQDGKTLLPCENLVINPTHDAIEPKAKVKANPQGAYNASKGTNSEFGAIDTSDFPEV